MEILDLENGDVPDSRLATFLSMCSCLNAPRERYNLGFQVSYRQAHPWASRT